MRKTLALVFSCLVCWLFAGGLCLAKEPEHTLLFFFENVCASCHTEDTFYDLFNRCVSPEEKAELSYEIRTYNVFLDANMATYEEMLEGFASSGAGSPCRLTVMLFMEASAKGV